MTLLNWVAKKGFNYYYIGSIAIDFYDTSMQEWCTSNCNGKWVAELLRIDTKNKTVGGIHNMVRHIILFEIESDYTWFVCKWE